MRISISIAALCMLAVNAVPFPVNTVAPTVKPAQVKTDAIQDATVKDSTVKDSTVKDSTVKDSTVKYSTVKDSTVKDSTVKDSTVKDAIVAAPTTAQVGAAVKEDLTKEATTQEAKEKADQTKGDSTKALATQNTLLKRLIPKTTKGKLTAAAVIGTGLSALGTGGWLYAKHRSVQSKFLYIDDSPETNQYLDQLERTQRAYGAHLRNQASRPLYPTARSGGAYRPTASSSAYGRPAPSAYGRPASSSAYGRR